MSQRKEKYARSLERRIYHLEIGDAYHDARESRLEHILTGILSKKEKDHAAYDHCAGESIRSAERWKRAACLAIIALMLCAVLCLMIQVQATAEQPNEGIPVTETQEDFENQKIEAALLANAHVIEDCSVTWYTADTCGKQPGDPAYGITYTGEPVVEHLTCAVDPDVIPLYSDVFIRYVDGTIEQLWATDTGVTGNAIDIYTPDYDYAIQCGRQSLTVWWVGQGEDKK